MCAQVHCPPASSEVRILTVWARPPRTETRQFLDRTNKKWTQLSHGYSILQFYIQNKEVSSLNFQLDKLEFDTKDNERGDNAGETLRTHENIYGFYFLDTQNEFNQITGEVTTRTNYTSEVFQAFEQNPTHRYNFERHGRSQCPGEIQ